MPKKVTLNSLAWLAQTFKVLSRRITSLTFVVSLCESRRTSPVPRSFHSAAPASNLNSLARLNHVDVIQHPQISELIERDRVDKRCVHLKEHVLVLFVGLRVNLLSELNHGLKVDICFLLLRWNNRKRLVLQFVKEA